jgi:hypothetical protein
MISIHYCSFSKFLLATAAAVVLGTESVHAEVKGLEIMAPIESLLHDCGHG